MGQLANFSSGPAQQAVPAQGGYGQQFNPTLPFQAYQGYSNNPTAVQTQVMPQVMPPVQAPVSQGPTAPTLPSQAADQAQQQMLNNPAFSGTAGQQGQMQGQMGQQNQLPAIAAAMQAQAPLMQGLAGTGTQAEVIQNILRGLGMGSPLSTTQQVTTNRRF